MTSSEAGKIRLEQDGRTITLSEGDVEWAARLLRLIAGETDSSEAQEVPATVEVDDHGRQLRLSRARKMVSNRQLRSDYFNRAIFGEAAWDILLMLYIADSTGALQTQATLAKALATPPTTIQRWIDYLEKERLVQRSPHPTDRRTAFVTLLGKGRTALERYLAAVVE